MTQTRIPFDNWNMPVPVQVSQLVRDGDLAWTCGQCPLDDDGRVLFPGDLTAQAERVGDYIENVIRKGGLPADSVAKLAIYHAARGDREETEMLSVFRRRFGDRPLLLPVAVPHFYYDGMLIEVDVFAAKDAVRIAAATDQETVTLQAVDGGEMIWIAAHIGGEAAAAEMLMSLKDFSLSPDTLLYAHWFASHDADLDPLADTGLLPDRSSVVRVPGGGGLVGELTFVRGGQCEVEAVAGRSLLAVHTRRSGRFLWVSGTCPDGDRGIVDQTRAIMPGIGEALSRQGMDFANVVKSTTHYVGTASPEDLHENLAVRHGFYTSPGPASTGLPVAGLGDENARIAIDVIAVATS